MSIDLLRLVAGQIQVGQPLPFSVRDEQGLLLLAKGRVVASDAQRALLLSRGLYVQDDDIPADSAPAEPGEAPRRLTLFDLWRQTTARLDVLWPAWGARASPSAAMPSPAS